MLTFKYRIKDQSAKRRLRRHARACNAVWNYCVAQQRDVQQRYRAGEKPRKWASHFDLCKMTKGVGAMFDTPIHQQTVDCICKDFVTSRDKLKHAPRFRASFGKKRALGWIPFQKQSRQHDTHSVTYLGRRFYLRSTDRRPIPDSAKGGCFVEDSLGRWYVCFIVPEDRHLQGVGAVGIDLGLKSLAVLSDGQKIEAPQIYRQREQKLAVLQRANQRRQVCHLHVRIANSRRDYLHKLSTQLAARYALIAVGNVNSKQLAQTQMAKSVYDAGWSMFRNMLRYKSPGYVEIDERFTTQTCSCCGSKDSDMRPRGIAGLGIREWSCSSCGTHHDRDVNAAKNILALARSATRPAEGNELALRKARSPHRLLFLRSRSESHSKSTVKPND